MFTRVYFGFVVLLAAVGLALTPGLAHADESPPQDSWGFGITTSAIGLSADGSTALAVGAEGDLVKLNLADGIGQRADLPLPATPGGGVPPAISLSARGEAAWVTSGVDPRVYRVDLSTLTLSAIGELPPGSGTPRAVAVSSDGSLMVVATEHGLHRLDPASGTNLGVWPLPGPATALAVLADGTGAVAVGADREEMEHGYLARVDFASAGSVTTRPAPARLDAAAVAESNERVWVSSATSATVSAYAVADLQPVALASLPGTGAKALAVSADGNEVFAALDDMVLRLDTRQGAVTGTTSITGPASVLVASANGATITAGTPSLSSVVRFTGFGAPASQSGPVTSASGEPGPPTNVQAAAGNASVLVSWTAPVDPGISPIDKYTVTASPGGKSCEATGVDLSCTVTGLDNGIPYTFTVTATSAAGTSVASAASAAVTPVTAPSAPTNLTAVPGNKQIVMSWGAPSSNGGSAIARYTARAFAKNLLGDLVLVGQCEVVVVEPAPATFTCTITELDNGRKYWVDVVARNSAGFTGVAASLPEPVIPLTVPEAPSLLSATPTLNAVSVFFVGPAQDGGGPVTNYEYSTDGGKTWTSRNPASSASPMIIAGLTPGTTYGVALRAVNAAGPGNQTAPFAITTISTPVTTAVSNSGSGSSSGAGTTTSGSTLPKTGATATALVPVAAILLVVGIALTWASRRPRRLPINR